MGAPTPFQGYPIRNSRPASLAHARHSRGRPRVAGGPKAGGAPELARRDAARWICRLRLLQLHRRRREEGRRAVRRAGAPARREGGRGAGRLCQASRRGARRSPSLLPGARMQTLKLALLG